MSYAAAEMDRRIGALVQIGVVVDLDENQGLVQVDLGGPTTDWIPWATVRAGGDRTWWAPEPGEQVIVLAPSGELANAVVVGSIFQDLHPQPAASREIHRTEYADGSSVEFNRATSTLTVNVGSGQVIVNCASAEVHASDHITLDTPQTTCTGKLTVEGLLTYTAGMTGTGGEGTSINISGNANFVGGTITHDGKVIDSTHKHDGVVPGGGQTGEVV